MKKRIVTSYKNLSDELKQAVKIKYPNGYQDNMIRIDKGMNDFFYAIMLETSEVSYLIKVDVKVDDKIEDDKDYLIGDIGDDDKIVDSSDDDDE